MTLQQSDQDRKKQRTVRLAWALGALALLVYLGAMYLMATR